MRYSILVVGLLASSFAAGAQQQPARAGASVPARAVKKEAVVKPVEIPPGAQKVDDLTYRQTDAQGKNWTYRVTPFGVVKYETPAQVDAAAQLPPGMVAFDEGDTVRFERDTPFGRAKWSRKKSELDEVEKLALERAQSGAKEQK